MPSTNDRKTRVTASVRAAIVTISGMVGVIVAGVALQFIESRLLILAIAVSFLLAAVGILLIALENTQPGKRLHVWVLCAFLGVVFVRFVWRYV